MVMPSIVPTLNCIFSCFLNFDYKVWVLDFKFELGVFMAPSLSKISPGKQGFEVEYVQKQLELEACYAQKRKNDTQEHVKNYKAQKVVVVIAQVQEAVTLKGRVKSTPNKNM